ncbi:holo-ACP synthase [Ornithinibacillus sp. 4-3]|uniref:Holo-[acyl-carrier-protein] synthase n=1 Tax=Ornithinibacillus sp. 4-3 TaxID=3231488 RepID=A0AB39HMD6_9BACI
MIVGIGLDIVELKRIENSLTKGSRLMKRVLTLEEQKLFTKLSSERRKIEFLAGRFAAKEAFAKAAGTGIGKLSFQDMEVLKNEQGAPVMTVQGYKDYVVFISITHSEAYAVAQVIIEDVQKIR